LNVFFVGGAVHFLMLLLFFGGCSGKVCVLFWNLCTFLKLNVFFCLGR